MQKYLIRVNLYEELENEPNSSSGSEQKYMFFDNLIKILCLSLKELTNSLCEKPEYIKYIKSKKDLSKKLTDNLESAYREAEKAAQITRDFEECIIDSKRASLELISILSQMIMYVENFSDEELPDGFKLINLNEKVF